MSDTVSISSSQSGDPGTTSPTGGAGAAITVEEVGQFALHPDFVPKRLVLLDYTLAALSEDGRLLLGEVRTRGGDDWTLAGRTITALPGSTSGERRYLDLAVVANVQDGRSGASLVLLTEKVKSKDRMLVAHHIRNTSKAITLDQEEFTCYEKANVLGKGVSHIAADAKATEPTVYSISNLVRKLRLEDGGNSLKPTPARAQVPAEAQDGTLSLAVQSGGGGTKAHQPTFVVASFRTKSATKNKFMVEWFSSGKKDDVTCAKCAVKMGEDSEPVCVMADPRDARGAYALCVNRAAGTTSLHKLTRGRKLEEPLTTFPFEADMAAMGVSASDRQCVTLLVYHAAKAVARVYTLQKTEGFRGRHPACGRCPPLELLSCQAHICSCSVSRWQLSPSNVDEVVAHRAGFQLGLATLLEAGGTRCVQEPESGNAYRLRVLSCPAQGLSVAAIVLDDLERQFDGSEDKLSSSVLKLCLSGPPCRESVSNISAWLMAGRIMSVEVTYAKTDTDGAAIGSSSDRLVMKPISVDKFRGFVTDIDWTQVNQRQGTFTLDNNNSQASDVMSASLQHPSSAGRSRIPRMSSSMSAEQHHDSMSSTSSAVMTASVPARPPPVDESLLRSVSALTSNLRSAKQDGDTLRTRMADMERQLEELRAALSAAARNGAQQQLLSPRENGDDEEEEEEEIILDE